MMGNEFIEKWICEETWLLREELEVYDIRLAEERLRLIGLKHNVKTER